MTRSCRSTRPSPSVSWSNEFVARTGFGSRRSIANRTPATATNPRGATSEENNGHDPEFEEYFMVVPNDPLSCQKRSPWTSSILRASQKNGQGNQESGLLTCSSYV